MQYGFNLGKHFVSIGIVFVLVLTILLLCKPVLAENQTASVSVYIDEENWQIPEYGASLNIHYPSFNEIFQVGNEAKYQDAIDKYLDLGFSQMRFPNGNEITFYDWTSPKDMYVPWGNIQHAQLPSVEEMLQFAEDTDSDVIFEMTPIGLFPEEGDENTVLNTHSFSAGSNPFYVSFTEEEIREFVRTYSKERKENGQKYIKFYELGNEDYGIIDTTLGRDITEQEYMNVALQLVDIIREETNNDTDIEILGISTRLGQSIWAQDEYIDSSDSFDYITNHVYWRNTLNWPEGDSLFALDLKASEFEIYQNLFEESIPKFSTPAITEWNYWCWGEDTHQNVQKYEHALYVMGYLLTSFNYQIPINTYLAMSPDDLNDGNLFILDGENLEFSPPGVGINLIHQYWGNTHVKTVVDSPKTSLTTASGSMDYDNLISYASKRNDEIQILVLNRDGNSSIHTSITLEGIANDTSYRYSTIKLYADSLSSGLEDIIIENSVDNILSSNYVDIEVAPYEVIIFTFVRVIDPVIPTPPPYESLPDTSIARSLYMVIGSVTFCTVGMIIKPRRRGEKRVIIMTREID